MFSQNVRKVFFLMTEKIFEITLKFFPCFFLWLNILIEHLVYIYFSIIISWSLWKLPLSLCSGGHLFSL